MPLERIKAIVGPRGWNNDASDMAPRLVDWRGVVNGSTPMIVSPASTSEVAAVVSVCHEAKIGVVPQGGNTGMCAGAVPDESGAQLVLSLHRMNTIRHIDAANNSMEVEAGCILENVQRAAGEANRLFALSLGAEGSCQIGGNLATNAGGINVIRYGTARAQILGIEAVLANGSVLNSLRSLRKDTAGYDLKQLLIGSEGTLGIITAATLKLHADPGEKSTAFVALRTSGDAVRFLAHMRAAHGETIDAFELISDVVLDIVVKHVANVTAPIANEFPWYLLVEISGSQCADRFEESILDAANEDLIADAVIAKNAAESGDFWRLRHSIAEAERAEGESLKHDISVPISKIETFLKRCEQMLRKMEPQSRLIVFGHVGDGNLHYNVELPQGSQLAEAVTESVYDLVCSVGGSISAEHGIGRLKRDYLPKYRDRVEIELMRTIKSAMDPHNILNPGKIF